ncbi:inositol monophosphatase family protein [Cephaloticoccus capnophilus]|uniref:inositol monophosphatase family protein n=1 Tax=Cephaloticoccus capnophilus TaxID=1548208 RepID=UPI001E3A7289|nr:inositol monophosphatase [Cephaloticoccus capnophilus]
MMSVSLTPTALESALACAPRASTSTEAAPELLARIQAARAVVLSQVEFFHREFGRAKSRWKADGSRVTTADLAISENVARALLSRFEQDQCFSEELEDSTAPLPVTAKYCWVFDPIDGTNNYALGLSHSAISLGLLCDGVPVYGVIYDGARRVLMHGGPGFGVWDGERRVEPKPEGERKLSEASLIGFHSPYESRYAVQAAVLAEVAKLRALGASALHMAYVAVGLFDAVVDHNVKIWDIAAAVPMILATGGAVHYLTPPPFPLRNFDVNMGRIFCIAGNGPPTVSKLRQLLGVRRVTATTHSRTE